MTRLSAQLDEREQRKLRAAGAANWRAAMRLTPVVAAFGLLSACMAGERPAPFGRVANGEALARQWCADCHVVAPDQRSAPHGQATSLAHIAARPGSRADDDLRRFLAEEHLPMPTFRLRPEEREDIVSYIRSLRAVH
jgi:mono/diheme cytochrome c family protein